MTIYESNDLGAAAITKRKDNEATILTSTFTPIFSSVE